MSESALTLTYEDLCVAIGYYLGYGNDSLSGGNWQLWSAAQQVDIERALKEGLRRFYVPPVIDNEQHTWSFMRPTTTITLWASATGTATADSDGTEITDTDAPFLPTMLGQSLVFDTSENSYTITGYTSTSTITVDSDIGSDDGEDFTITCDGRYRMPDDFGGLVGRMMFTSQTPYPPMRLVGEGMIRSNQQHSTTTGRPTLCCIRPVETHDATLGQRYELLPWRRPDSSYTLSYTYSRIPAVLSATNLYPLGGMQMSEATKACCLWAAEEIFNDGETEKMLRAMEALKSAIRHDKNRMSPEYMGYNANEPRVWGKYPTTEATYVTYEGVDP